MLWNYSCEEITCQILWCELDGLVLLDVVQLLPHSAKTTNGLQKRLRLIYINFLRPGARLVLTIFGINE